jgi:hypothetical protein
MFAPFVYHQPELKGKRAAAGVSNMPGARPAAPPGQEKAYEICPDTVK